MPFELKKCQRSSFEAQKTMRRGKPCLISIIMGSFDLPISDVCAQCWKHGSVVYRLSTVFHTRYLILISDCRGVQFMITDAKGECVLFLRDVHNLWCPFRVSEFLYVHGDNSVNLLFLKHSRFSPAQYAADCITWLLSYQVWFGALRLSLNHCAHSTCSQAVWTCE